MRKYGKRAFNKFKNVLQNARRITAIGKTIKTCNWFESFTVTCFLSLLPLYDILWYMWLVYWKCTLILRLNKGINICTLIKLISVETPDIQLETIRNDSTSISGIYNLISIFWRCAKTAHKLINTHSN